MSCRRLLAQAVCCALGFALLNAGNNIPAKIAMIAMTTSNSIKVNARWPILRFIKSIEAPSWKKRAMLRIVPETALSFKPYPTHIMRMKVAIASDHAGFAYKEKIKALLAKLGHEVRDFGTNTQAEPADYPVFIRPAAEAVARGEFERAIVLGGSGNGEAIVANKVHGIRCALCWNEDTARWARQHNDANVLALGQRTIDEPTALKIVELWITTEFEGGRHIRRIQQIEPAA